MKSILCLFFHNWTSILLEIHPIKRTTRLERKCVRCQKRQILLSQFSTRIQRVIFEHYGEEKEYYMYKKGDWLDHYTRAVLIHRIDDE